MVDTSGTHEPEFMAAARQLAEGAGLDVRVFLARSREAMVNSPYPRPECLRSDEMRLLFHDGMLPVDRATHALSCADCSVLVRTAVPKGMRLEQYLEKAVRKEAEERAKLIRQREKTVTEPEPPGRLVGAGLAVAALQSLLRSLWHR